MNPILHRSTAPSVKETLSPGVLNFLWYLLEVQEEKRHHRFQLKPLAGRQHIRHTVEPLSKPAEYDITVGGDEALVAASLIVSATESSLMMRLEGVETDG